MLYKKKMITVILKFLYKHFSFYPIKNLTPNSVFKVAFRYNDFKNRTSYQPGPEKETPLSLHQEKKCSTHQPVEGEKE
jgi:hypothetical protein